MQVLFYDIYLPIHVILSLKISDTSFCNPHLILCGKSMDILFFKRMLTVQFKNILISEYFNFKILNNFKIKILIRTGMEL